MLGAIGGVEGAVFYRPVERAAPVGARAADPRSQPGVVSENGKPLSSSQPSLETLSREKRLLLAQLRGDLAVKERELLTTVKATEIELVAGDCDCEDENAQGLTQEEQAEVEALTARDREVRAHEQAHAAVGGAFAGSPSYTYQIGPDGQRYAVGGEVKIDVSPIPGDPEATLEKMRTVERAALAPAEPSPQDRKVAQMARVAAQEAQAEASTQSAAERRGEAEAGYAKGKSALQDGAPPIIAIAA